MEIKEDDHVVWDDKNVDVVKAYIYIDEYFYEYAVVEDVDDDTCIEDLSNDDDQFEK